MNAESGKRMFWEIRPSGAGEEQGVDPWTKSVPREGAEKAFLGSFSMGDDDGSGESVSNGGPEFQK